MGSKIPIFQHLDDGIGFLVDRIDGLPVERCVYKMHFGVPDDKLGKLIVLSPFIFAPIVLFIVIGGLIWEDLQAEATMERNHDLQKELLQERGLNTVPLVVLGSYPGFSLEGDIGGGFISFSGSIEGSSQIIYRFIWRTENGELILTELPSSDIIFVMSNEEEPRASFSFNTINMARNGVKDYVNPNGYMKFLNHVVITLNEEEIEKISPSFS